MRNLGLDLLRIIAVMLVIGRHLPVPEGESRLFKVWQQGGWVGVDLFFVLSGFLVSSLLFREHKRFGVVDTKRFLIRRGFKIYPAFWLFLLFSLVVRVASGDYPKKKYVIGELLFVQNYLGGVWDHTWSLAVEEHFYLGFAALVIGLLAFSPRTPFRFIPIVFCFVATACMAGRLLNNWWCPVYSHHAYLFPTHLRIDSLMFGVLLSFGCNYCDLEKRIQGISSLLLVLLGMFCLSPAFLFQLEKEKWISVVGVVPFYCGSGLILMAAMRLKDSSSVFLKRSAALGAASYSIYLWHMPVAVWGYPLLSNLLGVNHYYLYVVNAVVGACLVGWMLNRLIEHPVLLLRDRLFPSKSPVHLADAARVADAATSVGSDAARLGHILAD